MKKTNWAIVPLAVLVFVCAAVRVRHVLGTVTCPAFAGAQGGGATSLGGSGRSGSGTPVVMEVTNLNNSGSGSLRACIEASGPRTCVFRVAGIITPQTRMQISNPYITIACHTAPGEIIIGGPTQPGESVFISTHDVTIRYCTFSADNRNVLSGPSTGTMNLEVANGDTHDIIFDHITSRWAGNKELAIVNNFVGPTNKLTMQYSMMYEPHAGHPVGPGNAGPFVFPASENDFHHNLFVNFSHRIPESTFSGHWTNNITYNWLLYAFSRSGTVDIVGNKWIVGNLNALGAQAHPIHADNDDEVQYPGDPSYYLSGNVAMGDGAPNADQWTYANEVDGENGPEIGAIPGGWRRVTPNADSTFPIGVHTVAQLDDVVLPSVGNSQHLDCHDSWVSHRDAADTRIVNQYKNRSSGGFWPNGVTTPVTNQTSPSQIPDPLPDWTDRPIVNGVACTESQHDGIPDTWKVDKGYSTTDPNLWKSLASDGYTILEHYLNGSGALAPPPPVTPPSPPPTPGPSSKNLLNLVGDVKNRLLPLNTAVSTITRVCMMPVGLDNAASPIVDGDLGPQRRWCLVPYAATVIEITVSADAGTPNVIVARNHAGTLANLTSSALAAPGGGGLACSNTGGTTGVDGVTTCTGTLQNTSLTKGDWLELRSGTAGGTAKSMQIAVTYTINPTAP